MLALINARIYDYENFYNDSFVIFDEKIKKIGKMKDFNPKGITEVIDVSNNFVMPGFVCAHTHLYSAFARGMSIEYNPKTFKQILEQLWWKLDHFLDESMIYYSALSFGLEQVKYGSTTLIDHHASAKIEGSLNLIKKALINDLGIRAILAFETSDRFDVLKAIKENREFINKNKTSKIAGLFGMHASLTLTDETLSMVKKNLNNAGIHIHVAEAYVDEEDSLTKYNKTVVERLNDFNLINDKSLLVHCNYVSEKELDIIKELNAYITINVTSNMNNGVDLPNIKLMEEKGIKLMIGNDGLIQSMPLEYLNAYYSAHLKTKNPVGFSLEGIKKAIINSFDYTSNQFDIKLGKIKENYISDMIIVPYKEFTILDKNNIFAHIFFGMFPGLLPKHVIANGKFIIRNYEFKKSLNYKYKESQKQASKLWEIIKKEGNNLEFKN